MKSCILRFLFVIAVFSNVAYSFEGGMKAPEEYISVGSKRKAESGENEIIYPVEDGVSLILEPNETGLSIKDFEDSNGRSNARQGLRPDYSGNIRLAVPEEIQGRKINEVGKNAFRCSNVVASIELPDTVVKINPGAFAFCYSLREIKLPQHISEIEENVFGECASLETIVIPRDVEVIKTRAFRGCRSLRSIVLGDSLRKIDPYAFLGCKSLERIELPNTVEKIGFEAFVACSNLKSINIPQSLEEISAFAFAHIGLKEFKALGNIKRICAYAFRYSEINRITIGKNVEIIEPGAFADFPNLKELTIDPENERFCIKDNLLMTKDGSRLISVLAIDDPTFALPNGLVHVDDYTFSNVNLSTLSIPASILEIGDNAFYRLRPFPSLTIIVDEENPNFKSVDGALLTKDGKKYLQAPLGREGEYVVPNGVETISRDAFTGAKFKKITIPGSVKAIERFARLSDLEEVVIEDGVEEIMVNSFPDCNMLKTIDVPASVKKIGVGMKEQTRGFSRLDIFNHYLPFAPSVTLRVLKGSYAEEWAKVFGMKYETID